MHGDLSVTSQQVLRDLSASLGGMHQPALIRPSSHESAAVTQVAVDPEGAPDLGEQLEANRLKSLLTDPAVRVSTYQDDSSGRVVLQVRNRATGDLVEQFPSDTILRLAAALREPLVDKVV